MPLLQFTEKGIYCPQGDFYIDPWRPVDRAVITHAHSDHARPGSLHYLCHKDSVPLLRLRLGENTYQGVEWGEAIKINGVELSLHPAGHMIGSSQIRASWKGETWVASGDYKTENDGISGAFEAIPCHTFITESTFGLPIYHWKPQSELFTDIRQWITRNRAAGKTSVLLAYSLGKAQRLLPCLHALTDTILAHGAIANATETLIQAGWSLPGVQRITPDMGKSILHGSIVLAPPGADESPWMRRFGDYETGVCSGWMQVRGNTRRQNADAGFALSDHADWKGLLQAIRATGAEKVFVTHGFQSALSRYLNEQGIEAAEVKTEYGDDEPVEKDSIEPLPNPEAPAEMLNPPAESMTTPAETLNLPVQTSTPPTTNAVTNNLPDHD